MVPARRLRVALVEDHDATREELVLALGRFAERLDLVEAFGQAEAFLASPALESVDVALVDLRLPQQTGVELIRRLAETHPQIRAIALTAFDDEQTVIDVLQAGAFGYLLKDESMVRIVSAVEEAAAGEHPVSSRIAGFLVSRLRADQPSISLSARETQLARELAKGRTYGECAAAMDIGIGTVQDHVKSLYRKLRVRSRAEVRTWVEAYLR
jgi:DNA-binding NarL/FixJ family response regulator